MISSSPSQAGQGGFKIRNARRGDASEIVSLFASEGMSTNVDTVAWIVSHPEIELFVAASSSDRPIAAATLYHGPVLFMGGRCGTINDVCVTRPWRRKGVGRELVTRVIERARVLSLLRLTAPCLGPSATELQAFFISMGFTADAGHVLHLDSR